MPGYRMHVVGGIAAFGVTLALVNLAGIQQTSGVLLQWIACAVLGSLFPDIDTKSMGQNIFYKVLFVCMIVLIIKKQFVLISYGSLAAMVPLIVRHRGITHSAVFICLLPIPLLMYVSYTCPSYTTSIAYSSLFFVAGALSHLMLDFGIGRFVRV